MVAKIYIKGYKNRPTILLFGISVLLVTFIIFIGNKNALSIYSAQSNLLIHSTFEYGYVLNYHLGLDNEYAFPDTDIVFYKDESGDECMPISCYMQLSESDYNSDSVLWGITSKRIASDEIVLSKNTLKENGLKSGDSIWADFPNKKGLFELIVVSSEEDGYDLFIDNLLSVGLGVMGNDKEYLMNISCKYIVFSADPLDVFVQQPQALKSAFTKGDLLFKATKQLLVFALLFIAMVVAEEIIYGLITKTSMKILGVMIRKGYKKRDASALLLLEFLITLFVPLLLGVIVWSMIFTEGIAKAFLCGAFCAIIVISAVPLFISRLVKYEVMKKCHC